MPFSHRDFSELVQKSSSTGAIHEDCVEIRLPASGGLNRTEGANRIEQFLSEDRKTGDGVQIKLDFEWLLQTHCARPNLVSGQHNAGRICSIASLHLQHQRVSLYQTTKIENLEGVHQVSASQRAKEISH